MEARNDAEFDAFFLVLPPFADDDDHVLKWIALANCEDGAGGDFLARQEEDFSNSQLIESWC
jgi:hypothetical protein